MLSDHKLPVDPNSALTTSVVFAWPYLQGLHLPEVAGEVLLLISVDTTEAIWATKESRIDAGKPYAIGSTLEWFLVGLRARVYDASKNLGECTVAINFLSASRKKLVGFSNSMFITSKFLLAITIFLWLRYFTGNAKKQRL